MKSESVLLLNEDAKDNLDLPISREHKPMMRSLMQLFMFPRLICGCWLLMVNFLAKRGLLNLRKEKAIALLGF